MDNQTQFHVYKMNFGVNDFTYNSHFQKVFKKSEMNIPECVIEEIKGLKFRDVLNSSYIERSGMSCNFLNSLLFDEDENYYKFHFEFDTFFYYRILYKYRTELKQFVELIEKEWSKFTDDYGYHVISIVEYKRFYNSLNQNNFMKLAIDNLIKIVPFSIYTNDDLMLKIDTNKIKKVLKEACEYLKK